MVKDAGRPRGHEAWVGRLSIDPDARGDIEIPVLNFALVAVLELVEILESHWFEAGIRDPDDVTSDELKARRRRTILLAALRQDREISGSGPEEGLVARDFFGTTVVPVPSGLAAGARTLIGILDGEPRDDGRTG
jgi:hypothetical protein